MLLSRSLESAPREAIDRFYNAVRPSPPLTVDQWVESDEGLVLSERTSAIAGPMRLAVTPYLRFPLQQFTNPNVERIGFCGPRQGAKSSFLHCLLGYIIDYDPGPTQILLPTQSKTKEISKDRIQPLIEDCPSLRKHLTDDADDFQLLAYTLDRLTVRFAWGGSDTSTKAHPIRYLLEDECSAIGHSACASAEESTKSYWNRKIIKVSTPEHPTDEMWRYMGLEPKNPDARGEQLWWFSAWEAKSSTTVYWYYVPCLKCGKFILLEIPQIRWPQDCAIRDLDDNGWYECQECRRRINDGDKPEMIAAGEWRTNNPGGKWIGFHMNSLYPPWDSCRFGAVAAKMVRARAANDPEVLGSFVNFSGALPFSLEQAGQDLVTEAVITSAASGYHRNQIPDRVRALTLGADVREEQVHWAVHGWGPASECWTIAWGIFQRLEELETMVKTHEWIHPTGVHMKISVGACDARYKKYDVVEMCRRLKIIKPVFGETQIYEPGRAGQLPWKTTALDRDAQGKAIVGSIYGYRINTIYWKSWLYSRLNHPPDKPKLFHLPSDRDATYERHLQSEQEVRRRKRGSGEMVVAWVVRKGFDSNHFLDANVYSLGIAHVNRLLAIPEDAPVLGTKPDDGQKKEEGPKKRPSYITGKLNL